jgi:hypothetical protein
MVNLTYPELAEISNASLPPASIDALKSLRNRMCESSAGGFKLQSQQKFLRRVLSPDSPVRNLLMVHGTGAGKCHGIDTPILMYDGSVKMVQDVVEGDLLMGDDSTPRKVLSLAHGRDQMFKVSSTKGDEYVVNKEHILCLQHTSTKHEITEIEVQDYLKLSKKLQVHLKGYRTGVDFKHTEIDMDPYFLGVWLGDGSQRDPVICNQDATVLKYIAQLCSENNTVLTYQSGYEYRISSISKKIPNVFLEYLRKYDLINNKHIPTAYKVNTREIRLQVLAGLIDTDGYLTRGSYEITQKSKTLANDIVFLARSLGFMATVREVEKSCVYKGQRIPGQYQRIFISGHIDEIPTKILRKQASPRKMNKDVLRYGIHITPLGEGDYYGFIIDGNHRYVLGNFTVTHNTCTAIQIAEEYILRPEFQDKKVMVVASSAVQENFRTQIFDMSRVNLDLVSGTLESKQCTGRRYLDMLMRIESEPKNWNDPEVRDKLDSTAKKIINEFYEFVAYTSFGNMINEKLSGTKADIDEQWVHDNFDNRLLIIDEAHNITESKDSVGGIKGITRGLENLVKTANGLVLVLLTATPMYDTFDTIVFYMNLFLWNDRRQKDTEAIKVSDLFNSDGTLKPAGTNVFRNWCSEYVSFIKGENPFTFPFRLSPPKRTDELPKIDFKGKAIADVDRLKYLTLVGSDTQGYQREILTKQEGEDTEEKRVMLMQPTLLVLPGNKTFNETFKLVGKQYEYVGTPCLTPDELKNYSAKFATVIDTIVRGQGIALVYSNFVAMGARPFAMALEEHGFTPALGNTLLAKPSYSGTSRGKYILLSSSASESEFNQMMKLVKSKNNRDGDQVRVIVMSPMAAEGIDFRYVRQVHILDPWWNMSRNEQVIGRGLRTCSHQLLPFEQQNCTVYLHVVRADKECYDEYTYRTKVEQKAMRIARVRKVMAESAMDCPMQNVINTLPEDWRNLEVPQRRSENGEEVVYRLAGMLAPAFDDTPDVDQCIVPESQKDTDHVRPLSTYLDVRDEVLEKLGRLMIDKAIWNKDDLLAALRPYTPEVAMYNIQHAIQTGFRFKDSFGRSSLLESRGDLYALSPDGTVNGTLVDRTTQPIPTTEVQLPSVEDEGEEDEEKPVIDLNERRASVKFPLDANTRFSEDILNSYVFDHLLKDDEKRALLKQKPSLPFVSRLFVPNSEYIVLGDKTFEPTEPPVGRDLTEFQAWNDALVARFIENKNNLFASVRNGKLTISKMIVQDDGTVVRKLEKTAKKYDPIACGTGDNDIKTVGAFVKFIDKNGIGGPGKFANAGELCMYTELLAREEHNCMWITPEELSVLYDSKENKAKFTQAFKK